MLARLERTCPRWFARAAERVNPAYRIITEYLAGYIVGGGYSFSGQKTVVRDDAVLGVSAKLSECYDMLEQPAHKNERRLEQ